MSYPLESVRVDRLRRTRFCLPALAALWGVYFAKEHEPLTVAIVATVVFASLALWEWWNEKAKSNRMLWRIGDEVRLFRFQIEQGRMYRWLEQGLAHGATMVGPIRVAVGAVPPFADRLDGLIAEARSLDIDVSFLVVLRERSVAWQQWERDFFDGRHDGKLVTDLISDLQSDAAGHVEACAKFCRSVGQPENVDAMIALAEKQIARERAENEGRA